MSHLLSFRLNVKNLPKDKMVKGEKGVYIDLTFSLNDEENEYNQSVSAWIAQSQEERENNQKRNYVGNGRVIWSDGTALPVPKKPEQPQPVEVNVGGSDDDDDIDLPF